MSRLQSVRIDCSKLNDIHSIFESIASSLHFPDYYGHNADAWDECMRDLEWVEEDQVAIILSNFTSTRYRPEYVENLDRPDDQRQEASSTRHLISRFIFVCDFWSEEEFVRKQLTTQKKMVFVLEGTDGSLAKIYSHEDWLG